jgi:hypothetical protein
MTIKITKEDINDICCQIKDSQIANINNFVMFVGHAHSGHSLIGALIDSHQNAAISNHVNIPKLILDHDLSKQELLKLILFFSLKNAKKEAWINTGYSYRTESGFQGTVLKPLVLGDKQGGASTRILMKNPQLINKLTQMFGDQLKIIFIYRNTLDNIAAFAHYMQEDLSKKHVNRYFENLESVFNIKKHIKGHNWFQLKHEDFISNPQENLKRLFDFLQLKYADKHIANMCKIVKDNPNKRRDQVSWNSELLAMIESQMENYSL